MQAEEIRIRRMEKQGLSGRVSNKLNPEHQAISYCAPILEHHESELGIVNWTNTTLITGLNGTTARALQRETMQC